MDSWQQRLARRRDDLRERWALADHALWRVAFFLLLVLGQLGLGWYWSREPGPFAVVAPAASVTTAAPVSGQVLTQTLVQVVQELLQKPGGYLRNDLAPPGLLLDNIPSWELGVLQQVRGLTRALHGDPDAPAVVADTDLAEADAAFHAGADAWAFPSSESEYRRGLLALQRYQARLAAAREPGLGLHRAELMRWLVVVDDSLGQSTAELNAALPDHPAIVPQGERRLATALPTHPEETSWWQVDDVFYQARGSAWALMHLLKAVEIEFGPELARHQAQLSLRAAIHELEATQQTLWSPVVLNGSGFGVFANHSLVMANYLGRARADLADVRDLLEGDTLSVTALRASAP